MNEESNESTLADADGDPSQGRRDIEAAAEAARRQARQDPLQNGEHYGR